MKAYVKPELFYERYELSQHVAACAWDRIATEGVCGFKGNAIGDQEFLVPDYVIINGDTPGCEKDWEFYCYTGGAEGMTLFNS